MACCMRSCQPPPWPAPSARATPWSPASPRPWPNRRIPSAWRAWRSPSPSPSSGWPAPTCPRRPSSPNWPARVAAAHLDSGKPSMNKIWIAIEAGGSAVAGALASAALRKAATERGWDCDIEIRNAAGMQQAYAGAAPKPGDVLLLIGGAQPAVPQAGLARGVAGLDEALAAPDRVIAAAIAQGQAPDTGAGAGRRPRGRRQCGAPLRRRVPWRSSRRRQTHRCRHVLPHRHRPYFHGGRGFDTGRPRPRSSHPRRDAGDRWAREHR